MTTGTMPFDAAEYIETDADAAALIADALEAGDPAHIRHVLNIVARARGMSEVARIAGISREGLYKAIGEDGDPKLSTLVSIMSALNVTLTAKTATPAE